MAEDGCRCHSGVSRRCLLFLLAVQVGVACWLYAYISRVESRCGGEGPEPGARSKRAANDPLFEDNAVNVKEPSVEFVGPAAVGTKAPGAEGETPDDPWVWLTAYSRIPVKAIQGFCSATQEYCPPGAPGSPGPPGPPGARGPQGGKGERGDRGLPGSPGSRGPHGMHGEPGPRGPKGEAGLPGSPGLDGRDGVPGEPGLDGMPGRNGQNGVPGLDGTPGLNGLNGRHGVNGTDGRPGATGPQGPPGPKGARGIAGPRGKPGRSGKDGEPGIPGITAWRFSVNGSESKELLIPPAIAGAGSPLAPSPIVVHEGENVRLRCGAIGTPRPSVEWRKLDGSVIPMGSWQTVSVSGHTLNITRITRAHMGTYLCLAVNGVPPPANMTFTLEVHFPPLIRILNQMVGAVNGSTAVLECEVEAFPEAVRYWERADGRLLEPGDKYSILDTDHGKYKAHMQLNVSRVELADLGLYHCIAKNEMGITKGVFTLFEVDPRLATPPPVQVAGEGGAVYGQRPPTPVDLDDLCPPPPACPKCPAAGEARCYDGSVSLLQLVGRMEVRPFGNATFPGLQPRTTDCQLYAVGKPVYNRYTEASFGCWMRDPSPSSELQGEKLWVTTEADDHHLYEYANKSFFRKEAHSKKYKLDHPFKGNAHVIYNGSFFYNERDKPRLLKFHLKTESYEHLDVPGVFVNSSNYLYTTENNYMDFSVDDNGLWVIYGLPGNNNNTVVMKIDPVAMKIQYMWNISIDHHKFGEMFIVCGVLYAVDSVVERNTKIRFALDLYKNNLLEVHLPFTNPFRRTTMIGYNHRSKELYTWDKGNQLTYPVRYHEIGYNVTKDDRPEPEVSAVKTGVEVDGSTPAAQRPRREANP